MRRIFLVLAILSQALLAHGTELFRGSIAQSSEHVVSLRAERDIGASSTAITMPKELKSQRKDIDLEITNARLRAQTGSKSLYSMQTSFTYNGGSIQDPMGNTRPQLSPGTVENDPTKLIGRVAAKYRATDHDNINMGIGIGWLTPGYSGQKGQSENPYASYNRVFKSAEMQNIFEVFVQKYTAQSSVANGLNYESTFDHVLLVPIAHSKLNVGATFLWSHEYYNRSTGGLQDKIAMYPFVEYGLNPTFSVRTNNRSLTYFNTGKNPSAFQNDEPSQSLGVGISLARDIYLYPNIQWVWADIRSEKTNLALSANINL
jgi:hypothetical protein